MNLLVVCTLNKARSITAERLYRGTRGVAVRSAGTSERAGHRVDACDLAWADRILVFEAAHAAWIHERFAGDQPEISDLGIADDFPAGDPALVAAIRDGLSALPIPQPRQEAGRERR